MAVRSEYTVFDASHPMVPGIYFAGVIVLAMFALQPVFIGISLAGALALSFLSRGVRETFAGLRWQLPMLALVCLLNPLFSTTGSTELFRIGSRVVYLESLAYGVCMGMLLMAVVLWFEDASRVLTPDKVLALATGVAPTVVLMASMAARLVPQLVRRARLVRAAAGVCSVSQRSGVARGRFSDAATLSGVLMGWVMEDSLETADVMRARGWDSATKRTSYQLYRFSAGDKAVVVCLACLIAACAFLAAVSASHYAFYPVMSRPAFWWGVRPLCSPSIPARSSRCGGAVEMARIGALGASAGGNAPASAASALSFRDVSFSYPASEGAEARQVLVRVTAEVRQGEFVLLAGATGSGKTTLLSLAKREVVPAGALTGTVEVFGHDVMGLSAAESSRLVGYVFQNPETQVVCDSVWHEMAFGLENLGTPAAEMRLRVAETCHFFGIEPWFEQSYASLSGGQRQILALAATLVMRPRLLLLDEPTSMLDPVGEKNFLHALFRVNRELGVTVVVAMHRAASMVDYATGALQVERGGVKLPQFR